MIDALYFDGHSARGQPVRLRLEGGFLVADGATAQRWPLAGVEWPERTRHGQRVIQLRGGGSLRVADATAFDDWRRTAGARESWVVRAQQNWRATLAAALALLAVVAAGMLWGVPLASRLIVAAVPPSVDAALGESALAHLGARWLQPSALPPARQQALRSAFEAAVAAAYPAGDAPAYVLRFDAAHKAIGANAFALPGGTIVLTDTLVERLAGHDDTLVGVLAHELGHLRHRHGMRALVQVTLIGVASSVALGDFSSVLAGVPVLLGQMAYSRDAEREADGEAARVLRASGRSPEAMVVLFEALQREHGEAGALPIAFASHPMDEERVRFFRDAARAAPN